MHGLLRCRRFRPAQVYRVMDSESIWVRDDPFGEYPSVEYRPLRYPQERDLREEFYGQRFRRLGMKDAMHHALVAMDGNEEDGRNTLASGLNGAVLAQFHEDRICEVPVAVRVEFVATDLLPPMVVRNQDIDRGPAVEYRLYALMA